MTMMLKVTLVPLMMIAAVAWWFYTTEQSNRERRDVMHYNGSTELHQMLQQGPKRLD